MMMMRKERNKQTRIKLTKIKNDEVDKKLITKFEIFDKVESLVQSTPSSTTGKC